VTVDVTSAVKVVFVNERGGGRVLDALEEAKVVVELAAEVDEAEILDVLPVESLLREGDEDSAEHGVVELFGSGISDEEVVPWWSLGWRFLGM